MTRWFEGFWELAFKPTQGGYVFQPLGRAPAYLVNEAQKAALATCLRRCHLQILLGMMAFVLISAGLVALLATSGTWARLSPAGTAAVLIVIFLGTLPIVLLPFFYAVRAMRPLLAGVPRTDERITKDEQPQRLAGAISPKVLWLAGAGGTLMVVAGIMMIGDAMAEGRSAFWSILGVASGALATGSFIYVGMRGRNARRSA